MKNTINNLPTEIQAILGAICRKWQSDFLAKTTGNREKSTKKDLEQKRKQDYIYIEKLTEAIEKLNNGKIYTEKGLENLPF